MSAEELSGLNQVATLKFSATNLDKKVSFTLSEQGQIQKNIYGGAGDGWGRDGDGWVNLVRRRNHF